MSRTNQYYNDRNNTSGGEIMKVFKEFHVLLNDGYYEGTKFASDYKEICDGLSKIYVHQPIEDDLATIVDDSSHSLTCLVGFTGMGKTMLLKNHFKRNEFEIDVKDGKLTIYISFQPVKTVANKQTKEHIIHYINNAIELLCKTYEEIKVFSESNDFWQLFFKYIEEYFEFMKAPRHLIPSTSHGLVFPSFSERLKEMEKEDPLKYYCAMLTFLAKQAKDINRIIFIFDDIEAIPNEQIRSEAAGYVLQVDECLLRAATGSYKVKTIFAVKSYSFRHHKYRMEHGSRFNPDIDVILKKDIPKLSAIFDARLNYVTEEMKKRGESKKNISIYQNAREILAIISNLLSWKSESLICHIANNDIIDAFGLFIKILANDKYFVKNREVTPGAIRIDPSNYNLDSLEKVVKAMVLGEGDVYNSYENNPFCNILKVHNEEQSGCEMIGLYIIKYFLMSHKYGNNDMYGKTFEKGCDVVENIVRLFKKDDTFECQLRNRLNYFMKFLYKESVLLRSIFDHVAPNESESPVRDYKSNYGLYLSWRGMELYNWLSHNSIFFQIFIDDIDTGLNIDVRTLPRMNFKEKSLLLIDYTRKLFEETEKKYISQTIKLEEYCMCFGREFLTSVLLEGIAKNANAFYPQKGNDYDAIYNSLTSLVADMKQYSDDVYREKRVQITLSTYFNAF